MSATPQPFSRMIANLLVVSFFGAALFMPQAPARALGGAAAPAPKTAACSAKTTQNACKAASSCWWKASSSQCRKKKNTSQIEKNNSLYNEGRLLAKSGAYGKAIAVLMTADQKNPDVLNYLGFSHRKSGDLKTAIGYYKAALKIDPNFVLARSYLGEGYVKAGRIDLAKLELKQIARRCGKGCKEYVLLAMAIETGDSSGY